MKRIFNVRLNLDDMAAGLDACCTDTEVGLWVRGFRVGVRGAALPDGVPRPMADGHALGLEAYQEASLFQEKQAEKGRASAESRKAKCNHGSTTVQPRFNHCSTTVRTNPQSTIHNQLETIHNPPIEPARDEHDLASPSSLPATDEQRWPYVQGEDWARVLRRGGVKIGPKNWPRWQTLLAEDFGNDPASLVAFACSLDPEKRWPDHVESEHRKRRPDAKAKAEGRNVVIL
jgi:hypothetical protein